MVVKKEVAEKDGLAVGMFGDIDILQKRHSLMIADLNAHMARYSEINKEQKATLNRELEFPEHALLSITQAARAYKDSSEAFELVLSHLVEFYRDYIDNMEIATDINKVSELYGMKIIKLENEIHKAATLRGIHVQRIEILTTQVSQYESELDAMQKKLVEKQKGYSAIPAGAEPNQSSITTSPDKTVPSKELQNSDVSNNPNNTSAQDPIIAHTRTKDTENYSGSNYAERLPNDDVRAAEAEALRQKDHNTQQPRRKLGRPRSANPSRTCVRCEHSWDPRKPDAKNCPECGMPWDTLPKGGQHDSTSSN